MSEGGYECHLEQVFRRATRYDIFSLDTTMRDRADSNRFVTSRRINGLCFGLVSTKTDRLERSRYSTIVARSIEEAGRFSRPISCALSTQCGFASVFTGKPIRDDDSTGEAQARRPTPRAGRGIRVPTVRPLSAFRKGVRLSALKPLRSNSR